MVSGVLTSLGTHLLIAVATRIVDTGIDQVFKSLSEESFVSRTPDYNLIFGPPRSVRHTDPPLVSSSSTTAVLEEVAMHICQFVETLGLIEARSKAGTGVVSLDEKEAASQLGYGLSLCVPKLQSPEREACNSILTQIENACNGAKEMQRRIFWELYGSFRVGGLAM